MNSFPTIRTIRSQAEIDALAKVAAADGHRVLMPTHLFVKDGEIIGYASLCAITPMLPGAQPTATQVNVWFSTQRFHARDTFSIVNCLEQIAGCGSPARTLIVPCCKESPLYLFMARMGYAPVIDTVLWGKAL